MTSYKKENTEWKTSYGQVPFTIETNSFDYQLTNQLISIQFIENNKVKININYNSIENPKSLIEYENHTSVDYLPPSLNYEQVFDVDKEISTPFAKFFISKKYAFETSKQYFIKFNNFNGTVAKYQNISINDFKAGTSLLKLSFTGSNKARLVEYLNTSVSILGEDQKENKIAYAIKTKNYIDTLFQNEQKKLAQIEADISKFKDSTNLYNVEAEGSLIFSKITQIDEEILVKRRSIDYIDKLKKYLLSHDQATKDIPAPTISEINEPTTISNTQELITLVTLKNELEDAGVTSIHPEMIDIRNRIKSRKKIVLENLKTLEEKNWDDIAILNKRLKKLNIELKKIPQLEQELIHYSRDYNQTEINYNYLKQKSYEAGTAIAANVSDIKTLDEAKDTGQGSSKPRTSFNYLVAVMLAVIIPLLYIIIVQNIRRQFVHCGAN